MEDKLRLSSEVEFQISVSLLDLGARADPLDLEALCAKSSSVSSSSVAATWATFVGLNFQLLVEPFQLSGRSSGFKYQQSFGTYTP